MTEQIKSPIATFIDLTYNINAEIDAGYNNLNYESILPKEQYKQFMNKNTKMCESLLKIEHKRMATKDFKINFGFINFQTYVFTTTSDHDSSPISKKAMSVIYKYHPNIKPMEDSLIYINGLIFKHVTLKEFMILQPYIEYLKIQIQYIRIRTEVEQNEFYLFITNIEKYLSIIGSIKGISAYTNSYQPITSIFEKISNLESLRYRDYWIETYLALNNDKLKYLDVSENNNIHYIKVNLNIEHLNVLNTHVIFDRILQYKLLRSLKIGNESSIDYAIHCTKLKELKSFLFLEELVIDYNIDCIDCVNINLSMFFNNLKHLELNRIYSRLDEIIGDIESLKYLKIKEGNIIINCPKIETLCSQEVDIKNIIKCELIKELSLVKPSCGSNSILNLDMINQFKHIKILTFEGFDISNFVFPKMEELEELNLIGHKDHPIKFTKDMFLNLGHIKKLFLKYGTITNDGFVYLENLEHLKLQAFRGFGHDVPNEVFKSFKILKTLTIFETRFKRIFTKDDFSNLKSLEELNTRATKIKFEGNIFYGFDKLKKLKITIEYKSNIDKRTFCNLPSLETLDLMSFSTICVLRIFPI